MGLKAYTVAVVAALLLQGCAGHHLPTACQETPSSGRCNDSLTRFYYDADWQECRAFIWGGCNGNAPFETMRDCTETCDAAPGKLWQRQQNSAADNAAAP